MEDESRTTKDPEVDAMIAIAQTFERLDRDAVHRVLDWAHDRYTAAFKKGALEQLSAELALLREEAAKFGVTDREMLHALASIRERRDLAPIDNGPPITDDDVKAALPT